MKSSVLHAQCTSAVSSGFPISQGNAGALDRGDRGNGKTKLISYLISNTSAKNYPNRLMDIKIIASQRWDVFETVYIVSAFSSDCCLCC